MNKITQLKRYIETVKAQQARSSDPEVYATSLNQAYTLLEQEVEKAKARRALRKARKAQHMTPATPLIIKQIPFVPTLNGAPLVTQEANNYELEVRLFAQQVMREQKIPGKIVFGSGRVSRAGKFKWGWGARFGSNSINRVATKGFIEYQQLKHLIRPYEVTGISGLRLLVLHELSHILAISKSKKHIQPHGSEFAQEYTHLLNTYQSALTRKVTH